MISAQDRLQTYLTGRLVNDKRALVELSYMEVELKRTDPLGMIGN
jgi:hypothetical protein